MNKYHYCWLDSPAEDEISSLYRKTFSEVEAYTEQRLLLLYLYWKNEVYEGDTLEGFVDFAKSDLAKEVLVDILASKVA